MSDTDEIWQRRIRDLYSNIEELYSHVDITVVVFDRALAQVSPSASTLDAIAEPLTKIARRVLDTAEPQRDVALDSTGRQRVHGFPLRERENVVGVACVVDDDGARRELFVRCAMAIFDGYRRTEAELLERERKALDEARRANRERDQFLAVVAHELRAPMTSILLWEQVLRSPTLDEGTRTSALDAIHESAAGQSLLVSDLLDMSSAINGKLQIERQPTSLMRVLAMAIKDARPQVDGRNLELVLEVDPELGEVLGDSRRLRQVIENLLSNAIKWTQQGRISVHARQGDDSIVIDVCDTGRGIPADFIPYVFEPFRQFDEGKTSSGLGLGLTIARQLVELHGGTLSVASEGLGRGTQFTVTLPRMRASGQDASPRRPRIAGIRVLVVDDDASILQALEVLLRAAGAIVATATSASAAQEILEARQTDILLSDIGMADEDGYSLIRRLRDTARSSSLPAIAVTARVDADSRERAFTAGFDRYLTKPVDLDLLLSSIAELVAR